MIILIAVLGLLVCAHASVGRKYAKFDQSFSLTGNGADDMVAIAEKQVGKATDDFGYTGAWCAAFIVDCATLANQEYAIPFMEGPNHEDSTHFVVGLRRYVLERGGQQVSSPQKGDLVFYYCNAYAEWPHVGLVINSHGDTIEGNVSGSCRRLVKDYDYYKDEHWHDADEGLTRVYIRPNYQRSDTTQPTITNVSVSDITSTGFTVSCTVSDNVGVTRVAFPTWTQRNNQQDIRWPSVTVNSGANESRNVSCRINISDYNNARGVYCTHIYAYDAAGNEKSVAAPNTTVPEPGYTLTVNSVLNGTQVSGAICGTFDVYINGNLVADDTSEYSNLFTETATYTITDFSAADGKIYKGADPITGTVSGANVNVNLPWETLAGLNIRFLLDGVESSNCEGYGTLDLVVNGENEGTNLTYYSAVYADSTASYEITGISCEEGKVFVEYPDNQPLYGTITKEVKTLTLTFVTEYVPTDEWQVMTELPEFFDPDKCEIEYKNRYEYSGRTSPGEEWTLLSEGPVQYENDGAAYESDAQLPTSELRKEVEHFYYHYCGEQLNKANWFWKDYLPTYHHMSAADNNSFSIDESGDDSDPARGTRTYYLLRWITGQYDGQLAYCPSIEHNCGSACWYIMYVYQNLKPYRINTYMRESDWMAEMDPQASSVTYRIRRKKVLVTFDPNGGSFEYTSITGNAGEFIDLYETVPVRAGYNFTVWTLSEDGYGEGWYAGGKIKTLEDVTLYAQWEIASRLILPSDLTTIGEEAFAGINAIIVEIPTSCTTIGSRAFADCKDLLQIYIPESTATIALNAFSGCTNLTIYAPAGSEAIRVARYNDIPYEIVTNP